MIAVYENGLLTLGAERWRAAIGHGGVVAHKQEGDGGTPAGLLPLRRILYRADRLPRPRAAVPILPARPPTRAGATTRTTSAYNRPVRLPHDARHEELWRTDDLYDVIGILGWNDSPPIRDHGSAIFLHLARLDYAPTEGCIALGAPRPYGSVGCGSDGDRHPLARSPERLPRERACRTRSTGRAKSDASRG